MGRLETAIYAIAAGTIGFLAFFLFYCGGYTLKYGPLWMTLPLWLLGTGALTAAVQIGYEVHEGNSKT